MAESSLPHSLVTNHTHRSRQVAEQAEKILAAYQKASENSFSTFYRGLHIDAANNPIMDRVIAPFQRDFFNGVGPSIQQLRLGVMPDRRRFWLERTKKASKDADLAIIVTWLCAFPVKPFFGQIGAVDRDQAKIIKDRVLNLLEYNPWLKDYVEIVHSEIRSKKKREGTNHPMCIFDVVPAEIGGMHGGTPDLLILNEVSHIDKWGFVEAAMANADGVPQGIVIIATNAGYLGSKAHVLKQMTIESPDVWSSYVLQGPAPWHDAKTLKDAKKRLGPSEYLRLWIGKWVSGTGDAVEDEKINKAFSMPGPLPRPEPGWRYIMGLDLGIKHDHAALFVLGINPVIQRLKAAYWRRWKPAENSGEVSLIAVEQEIMYVSRLYGAVDLHFDPHQAIYMAQRVAQQGINRKEMSFQVPSNLVKMATAYIQTMDSEKIQLYDDEEGSLRRDLGKFTLMAKKYGYRLEATSDEFGHADVGTALVICLPEAVQAIGLSTVDLGGLVVVDEKPLDDQEMKSVQELDPGLAALLGMDDRVVPKEQAAGPSGGPSDDIFSL